MLVQVLRVTVPPMSTIGYGYGVNEKGQEVSFVGDHRPMRYIGDLMMSLAPDPCEIELESWQIMSVKEVEGHA